MQIMTEENLRLFSNLSDTTSKWKNFTIKVSVLFSQAEYCSKKRQSTVTMVNMLLSQVIDELELSE